MSSYEFFYLIILIISLIIVHQRYKRTDRQSKYDKRRKIYNGLKEFLITVGQKGNATDEDLGKFHDETAECDFLFKDDIKLFIRSLSKSL